MRPGTFPVELVPGGYDGHPKVGLGQEGVEFQRLEDWGKTLHAGLLRRQQANLRLEHAKLPQAPMTERESGIYLDSLLEVSYCDPYVLGIKSFDVEDAL